MASDRLPEEHRGREALQVGAGSGSRILAAAASAFIALSKARRSRATAFRAAASMARKRRTTSLPNGVSAARLSAFPPARVATTGSTNAWLRLSTRSQARRYDMPMALPAALIEPSSATSSSSRTLPGPRRTVSPKSSRNEIRVLWSTIRKALPVRLDQYEMIGTRPECTFDSAWPPSIGCDHIRDDYPLVWNAGLNAVPG